MGGGALNGLADSVRTPITLFVPLAAGHCAGLLAGRAKNVVFSTHHVVTGSIEANNDDESRQEKLLKHGSYEYRVVA